MIEGWSKYILLENPKYFDFVNGLWKGKKPPYISINVIRNTNFTDSGKIDYSNVAVLDVEVKQFLKKQLTFGDIIIERSGGGPKQPVGRVVYFDKKSGNYSFSNFTSIVRVINEKVDSKYVFYFLMFFYNVGNTIELQSQTTGIRNLDFNKYKNTVIVPDIPLPEQRKIAYVLSTIQKAIEQQDKLIKTTTELKKALMQKLFTEGIGWLSGAETRQKQTEIGPVPESWEVVELNDICERISENIIPEGNGKKPYIGLEHIEPGKIGLKNWGFENEVKSSKSKFLTGHILYGKLRPYLDKAVLAHIDGICSTDILVFNGKQGINNDFLIHFFHTEKLLNHAKSTTSGVQHPRTSWNNLKSLKLGLPLEEEREEIASSLTKINNNIEFHEKKKQTLTDFFKTLLHELMTGQRRVHEIEFESAKEDLLMAAEPKVGYNNIIKTNLTSE